jgi:hypothetical protein
LCLKFVSFYFLSLKTIVICRNKQNIISWYRSGTLRFRVRNTTEKRSMACRPAAHICSAHSMRLPLLKNIAWGGWKRIRLDWCVSSASAKIFCSSLNHFTPSFFAPFLFWRENIAETASLAPVVFLIVRFVYASHFSVWTIGKKINISYFFAIWFKSKGTLPISL